MLGTSLIEASPEFIYATVMDFDNFHKISGSITDTHFVESSVAGEILGYTRIEACVLFFCRAAERVERVESEPNSEIRTESIPESSDFHLYETRWTFEREGQFTRMTYEARFRPDFWMPPLISTWAIERRLLSSAENLGSRLEYLASNGLTLEHITEPAE